MVQISEVEVPVEMEVLGRISSIREGGAGCEGGSREGSDSEGRGQVKREVACGSGGSGKGVNGKSGVGWKGGGPGRWGGISL